MLTLTSTVIGVQPGCQSGGFSRRSVDGIVGASVRAIRRSLRRRRAGGSERDGATDLSPDHLGPGVGRDMGLPRYRPQDSQSLRRHLNTALPKEVCRVDGHVDMVSNS